MKYIPCNCFNITCPCFNKCSKLPTEYWPYDGRVDVIFVGQGGGQDERKAKRPFIGEAGQELRKRIISKILQERRFGFAFSNTIRDCPEGNREPNDTELAFCMKFLKNDLGYLQENYYLSCIIPLGNHANQILTRTKEGITKDRGNVKFIKDVLFSQLKVVSTFHPAYLIRNKHKLEILENMVIDDILKGLNQNEG